MRPAAFVILILLGAFALRADEEAAAFTSARAREAQKAYLKAAEKLKSEYESKLRKAKTDYARALEAALKEAKKGDPADVERITKTLSELKAERATPAKGAKRDAPRAPQKIGRFTFSGGGGDSVESAIIIKGAADSPESVEAEGLWFKANLAGYTKKRQALLNQGGKVYDEIILAGPRGEEKHVFFDITEGFGF